MITPSRPLRISAICSYCMTTCSMLPCGEHRRPAYARSRFRQSSGACLASWARAVGAKRILEIGTLGGYSAIHLARALPEEGRLITLEIDTRHAEVARENLLAAGLAARVEVRLGPALDLLPSLAADNPFDLAFIDADKESYPAYLDWCLR